MSAVGFWAQHQVGGPYQTLEASVEALGLREQQFPTLESLMPTMFPHATILDYGCGPGHDTIRFLDHGASYVYYADVSPLAHRYMKQRLALHGYQHRARAVGLFQPVRVTRIHCAGVLHHLEEPLSVLHYFYRCLANGFEARVMIYDGDRSTHSQSEVPITHWWTQDEFSTMAASTKLDAEYLGSYECSTEWRPDCYAACYRLTVK